MSDTTPAGYTSVTDEGGTIVSSSETPEQITESLKPDAPAETTEATEAKPTDPKLAKAAAKLGQKGGEATAAKRAAQKEDAQEVEAEGDADAADAEGSATSAEGKLGKPRHDPKARMLEATRQAAEAKRERDTIRAEKDRLAAELEQFKAGKAAEPPRPSAAAEGKPKAEDFATYEEFVEAVADWKADQRFQTYQKQTAEQQRFMARDHGIRKAVTSFQGRMDEHAKADATFKERTADLAASLQPSFTLAQDQQLGPLNVIADEIINSEIAPALMLHFAEHPEVLQRLEALPNPSEVQRAIANIEGRLSAAPTATAPKAEVSQARPPVRPVSGAPFTANQEPGEEASYEDHKRYWNSRDKAARR